MKKSLIALAFGTLGLGIAEFTMMGILPYVATDLGISIPVAGHFISAYALGVCFGAPMLLLARKRPLKQILLVLMTLMIVGNICASMAPNYWVLLLGRFVSGLPHGAYFGVASIWRWVPQVEGLKDTGFKGQFRFLKKPAPWLILGATALGNGGVFCWYSYITPLLTEVSGFSAESITALMVLAGFGMVVGNLVSGRMSDRYTPGKVGTVVQGMICVILLLIFLLSPHPWCSAILMTLCTAGLFAVSSPEQVLMIRVAPGGEMLGGACVQMAFNLGNAIGAYIGGLALSGGYRYPALAGVPFALMGFILFLVFYKKFQAKY